MIAKSASSLLPVWFASPAYVYDALAVPAAVLFAYTGAGVRLSPPAPVTDTVHGVRGAPVNTTLAGHVTVVVDGAAVIAKFVASLLPVWFASPAYVYDALAVPTAVLLAYTGSGVRSDAPARVTTTLHGVRAAPVYTTLEGHVTVVVDDPSEISNVAASLLPLWFASPAYVYDALAVPTAVLFE